MKSITHKSNRTSVHHFEQNGGKRSAIWIFRMEIKTYLGSIRRRPRTLIKVYLGGELGFNCGVMGWVESWVRIHIGVGNWKVQMFGGFASGFVSLIGNPYCKFWVGLSRHRTNNLDILLIVPWSPPPFVFLTFISDWYNTIHRASVPRGRKLRFLFVDFLCDHAPILCLPITIVLNYIEYDSDPIWIPSMTILGLVCFRWFRLFFLVRPFFFGQFFHTPKPCPLKTSSPIVSPFVQPHNPRIHWFLLHRPQILTYQHKTPSKNAPHC